MSKRKIIGVSFVFIAMLLSLGSIIYNNSGNFANFTGGVIGVDMNSSLITILTLAFFIFGLLFLSRLTEKIIGGAIIATIITGAITNQRDINRQYREDSKVTSSYWTEEGKFQRAYRWDKELDRAERRNRIPKGLLKGIGMQESYGDPLRLNSGADGGAGFFMMQPRIAKYYGLDIEGDSNKSSADTVHGKQMKKLVVDKGYDYMKLKKADERFDMKKSPDAAARCLRDNYERYHNWDKAISAYNQGHAAPNAKNTKYVKAVREHQKYYNEHDRRTALFIHHKKAKDQSAKNKIDPKGHAKKAIKHR
jgi:hypothetical protein